MAMHMGPSASVSAKPFHIVMLAPLSHDYCSRPSAIPQPNTLLTCCNIFSLGPSNHPHFALPFHFLDHLLPCIFHVNTVDLIAATSGIAFHYKCLASRIKPHASLCSDHALQA